MGETRPGPCVYCDGGGVNQLGATCVRCDGTGDDPLLKAAVR